MILPCKAALPCTRDTQPDVGEMALPFALIVSAQLMGAFTGGTRCCRSMLPRFEHSPWLSIVHCVQVSMTSHPSMYSGNYYVMYRQHELQWAWLVLIHAFLPSHCDFTKCCRKRIICTAALFPSRRCWPNCTVQVVTNTTSCSMCSYTSCVRERHPQYISACTHLKVCSCVRKKYCINQCSTYWCMSGLMHK